MRSSNAAMTVPATQVETFVHYCRRLYEKGLVHACAGNVSSKCGDEILISASGSCLGDITPEDVVLLRHDGGYTSVGGRKPSSEWRIHRRIYEARSDIGAVVHAHPPKATALTIAGVALDQNLLAEIVVMLGKVPLIPYILPGSDALAEAVHEEIKTHHAVLLANHGVFATGTTLKEAYFRMELVESLAEMVIGAHQLGRVNELTPAQVQDILDMTGHVPLSPFA